MSNKSSWAEQTARSGRDVFILGAGFSKAIHDAMPVMDELGQQVRERSAKNPKHRYQMDKWGNNVELWMTDMMHDRPWLSQDTVYSYKAMGFWARRTIGEIIWKRTQEAAPSSFPAWLKLLTQAWHERKSVVITLNYDTLVEQAVGHYLPDIHTVNLYPPYFTNIVTRRGNALYGGPGGQKTFQLLKLHGSVNWYYSGQEDFYGETIFYSDVSSLNVETQDISTYPSQIAEDKEMLLIPPVLDKTPFFRNEAVWNFWVRAAKALQNARNVYLIGYSLPASDLGIQSFLVENCSRDPVSFFVINKHKKAVKHYSRIFVIVQHPNS